MARQPDPPSPISRSTTEEDPPSPISRSTTEEAAAAAAAPLARAPGSGGIPAAVAFLAGFSGEALRSMRQSLAVVTGLFVEDQPGALPTDPRVFPWHALERAHVKRIRERLSERYAPATARRHFAALRGVLREAGNAVAFEGVKGPKGASPEIGRALSPEDVSRLLKAARDQDRAIVAVGIFGGLRRFEIAALDLEDWDGERLTVRRGKGRESRSVKLAETGREALRWWIDARGREPGPLFYGRGKNRIGESTISVRLAALARAARVAHFTPHDLRRTFVTRILEKTGDLLVAQKLAGHKQAETTKRYDKRGREAEDRAAALLDEGID